MKNVDNHLKGAYVDTMVSIFSDTACLFKVSIDFSATLRQM